MSWIRLAAVALVGATGLAAVSGGGLAAAHHQAQALLDRTWDDVTVAPVPVPWPGSTADEAAARGEHLVKTRLGCLECHGQDVGGGIIVEAAPMGRWVAPNLTRGEGGRGDALSTADWVRAIREGITSDGTTSTMPSIDYADLSDREVSDVIAFMSTRPPVDRVLPPDELGPLRAVLIATGGIPLSAELIDHGRERRAEPPAEAADAAYGRHVAQACRGCHGMGYAGGPIPGGDPSWPEAANLTPSADGLQGWTLEDFTRALREGRRPDGAEIRDPMPWRSTRGMSDTEIEALYVWFTSLPPAPKGG